MAATSTCRHPLTTPKDKMVEQYRMVGEFGDGRISARAAAVQAAGRN